MDTFDDAQSEVDSNSLPGSSITKNQQQATARLSDLNNDNSLPVSSPTKLSDLNNDCDTADTCFWIEDLGLTYADKQIIKGGYSLNAAVINASSKRIKQENDTLAGLLTIAPSGSYRGNGELFVQILRVNNDHWVTMSNVFTDYANVSIYDSAMRLHYRYNSKEIRYNVSIDLDACNLRALPENKMTLYVEDTLHVKKDSDSGIAAIMFAIAIARNLDPQTVNFKYKHLRKRLLECFENLSFTSITFEDSPCRKLKRKFEFTVPLFCHCNKPDMGECMIQCGTCAHWFHMSCEGVEVESKDWKCKVCSDTGKVDMLHDVKQVDINDTSDDLSVSSDEGDSLGLSWNQLVKNVSQEYSDSCQPLDLHSFENCVKSSVRKTWVLTLCDESVPDFPSTP